METVILILVGLLILIGLAGIVIPVLPGLGLIFSGILLYALYFGIDTIGLGTLIVLAVIAAASVALEYMASAYGAKKFGASKAGSFGAIVGGLIGFFLLNVFGLILGIFVGAVVGEMVVSKKDGPASLRAGYGALLGFLGGTLIKIILGFMMVGIFLWKVLA